MSITLNEISAPALSSSTYASDLEEVFENINNNFKILANSGYNRGPAGLNLYLEAYKLSDIDINDDGANTYLDNIASVIYEYSVDTLGLSALELSGVTDQLDEDSCVYLLKTYDSENDTYSYISSLPFYFIDSEKTSTGSDEYADKSCVVVYQDSKWQVMPVLPTFYLNSEDNCLYWKLNGSETGILVNYYSGTANDGDSN